MGLLGTLKDILCFSTTRSIISESSLISLKGSKFYARALFKISKTSLPICLEKDIIGRKRETKKKKRKGQRTPGEKTQAN